MSISQWSSVESSRAEEIWADYQKHHDLSQEVGQTVGIDPFSGRVWFGESIQDVVAKRAADGSDAALFFVRVGSTTYFRKGGHR